MPPTILYKDDKDPTKRLHGVFLNLAPLINDVTDYHIYGNLSITDVNNPHHFRHCENKSKCKS